MFWLTCLVLLLLNGIAHAAVREKIVLGDKPHPYQREVARLDTVSSPPPSSPKPTLALPNNPPIPVPTNPPPPDSATSLINAPSAVSTWTDQAKQCWDVVTDKTYNRAVFHDWTGGQGSTFGYAIITTVGLITIGCIHAMMKHGTRRLFG
jgi:hypothetical protein